MPDLLTVSEVAERLRTQYGVDIGPKLLSDLIYRRRLPADAITTLSGRRMIDAHRLGDIVAELRRQGRIPAVKGGAR